MSTPADTLVTKYPDRISQLNGPVLTYLKKMSAGLPFNRTEQDLFMTVFYPDARRVDPGTSFSDIVPEKYIAKFTHDNPGINTPQDYINYVNRHKNAATLTPQEWTSLKNVAATLNVPYDSLYRLINFESGWNPLATNPYSGARGLIQFMPDTAKWLGFAAGAGSFLLIIAVAGVAFYIARKYGYI
jgi:hypothetical protein